MGWFHTTTHHPYVAQPVLSLSLTALTLLLLVLVLLSVPGPIKGLYWFSVENQGGQDGPLQAGVLGWCGEFAVFVPNLAFVIYLPQYAFGASSGREYFLQGRRADTDQH